MKRPILLLAAAALVALAIYAGYRALASDETRIRWVLEDAAASFNDSSPRGCLEAFHPDYEEKSSRHLDKTTLGRALVYLFQKHRDKKTGRFRYRVNLPEETLTITVEEAGRALATFELNLQHLPDVDGDWRDSWRIRVTAQLLETDGEWRIRRSSVETVSGSRPR